MKRYRRAHRRDAQNGKLVKQLSGRSSGARCRLRTAAPAERDDYPHGGNTGVMIPDVFRAHEWSLVGNHVPDRVKGFHETELPAALLFHTKTQSGPLLQSKPGNQVWTLKQTLRGSQGTSAEFRGLTSRTSPREKR